MYATARQSARVLVVVSGLVFGVELMVGCTTPASSEDMRARSADIREQHPYSVHLIVQGGQESIPGQLPQISDEEFKNALVESITSTKLFARIGNRNATDYLLEAIIFEISQWVFKTGVSVEIGWRLTDQATDKVVWQEAIKTNGEGPSQVDALEAAARENIELALERISRLEL